MSCCFSSSKDFDPEVDPNIPVVVIRKTRTGRTTVYCGGGLQSAKKELEIFKKNNKDPENVSYHLEW